MLKSLLLAGALLTAFLSAGASADNASPAGVWKNIDDHTGKSKALIRIAEVNGEFQGKVEKLFLSAEEDRNPKCVKCEDSRKDQPIIGMSILSGLKQDKQDIGEYDGGQILDAGNGKVYKCKMTLLEGGKKLKVRGYIGVPMFGRSQIWVREE
jgi:uncharacterized protein (DUF2147 family)